MGAPDGAKSELPRYTRQGPAGNQFSCLRGCVITLTLHACVRLRSRSFWATVFATTGGAITAWLFARHMCPPDHLCIPNDVGGSPSTAKPYVEYSDVTNTAAVYRVSSLIKTVRSPYQLVQVYESLFFGKILTIDGALMITERDEANYHESIVNTPLAYLPDARRVLVVGGGDGGTVTQLVKHTNLVEIVWVEIDEVVIQFAKEFFPRQAKALQDPRVSLRVQNAASFVQEARYPITGVNNGTFDAILIDSTDFNAAEPLFSASFYADCKALLSPRGALVFNLDSPQWGQVGSPTAPPDCPSAASPPPGPMTNPRHRGHRMPTPTPRPSCRRMRRLSRVRMAMAWAGARRVRFRADDAPLQACVRLPDLPAHVRLRPLLLHAGLRHHPPLCRQARLGRVETQAHHHQVLQPRRPLRVLPATDAVCMRMRARARSHRHGMMCSCVLTSSFSTGRERLKRLPPPSPSLHLD